MEHPEPIPAEQKRGGGQQDWRDLAGERTVAAEFDKVG